MYIPMRLIVIFILSININANAAEVSKDGSALDYNNDGNPDVTYDYYKDYFYEFIDRNYDTKNDVSNKFSYKTNLPIQTSYDNDFDGIPDTKVFYENGWVNYSVVDMDRDSMFDVYYSYEYGVLKYSEKYVPSNEARSGYIEKIEYQLGYPVNILKIKTDISHQEFLDERLRK